MGLNQLSGINTVMYYSASIFEASYGIETAVWLAAACDVAQLLGAAIGGMRRARAPWLGDQLRARLSGRLDPHAGAHDALPRGLWLGPLRGGMGRRERDLPDARARHGRRAEHLLQLARQLRRRAVLPV